MIDLDEYLKAFGIGLLGATATWFVWELSIDAGLVPFDATPLEMVIAPFDPDPGIPTVVHCGVGGFAAMMFAAMWRSAGRARDGLLYGLALWLAMMVAFAPAMGWGLFGSQLGTAEGPSSASMGAFLLVTLANHLLLGATIGALVPRWVRLSLRRPRQFGLPPVPSPWGD